ncbi:uncharacterized protein [Miscanthus floridulus]
MEVQQQHAQVDLSGTTMGILVTVVALIYFGLGWPLRLSSWPSAPRYFLSAMIYVKLNLVAAAIEVLKISVQKGRDIAHKGPRCSLHNRK